MRGRIAAGRHLTFIEAAVAQARGEPVLEQVADHHRHPGGHEQMKAARHLRDHQHGGDGNAGRGAEDRGHTDDDEDRGRLVEEDGEGSSEHGADKERRREDAARSAGRNGEREGDNLGEDQHEQQAQREAAVDGQLDPAIAACRTWGSQSASRPTPRPPIAGLVQVGMGRLRKRSRVR